MNDQTLSFRPHETANVLIGEPPIFDAIREAIKHRRVAVLRYDKDRLSRLFAPYLFRLAKNGNYVVMGMQISDANSLDGDNERRSFNIERIKSFELTDEPFVPVDTFTPNEPSHSTGIIACVLSRAQTSVNVSGVQELLRS